MEREKWTKFAFPALELKLFSGILVKHGNDFVNQE